MVDAPEANYSIATEGGGGSPCFDAVVVDRAAVRLGRWTPCRPHFIKRPLRAL